MSGGETVNITIDQFGKDHWSTFAYAESCVVDSGGRISFDRMRNNPSRHPVGCRDRLWGAYGTIIKGGSVPNPDHDDFDCLDDLEREGLLEQVDTAVNPIVRLTDKGWLVASQLRRHKAAGWSFSDFVPRRTEVAAVGRLVAGSSPVDGCSWILVGDVDVVDVLNKYVGASAKIIVDVQEEAKS